MLTFEQIKELIQEVADRGLEGLEVERSGFRLKIDGHKASAQAAPQAAPAAPAAVASPSPAEPAAAEAPAAAPQATPAPKETDGGGEDGHPDGSHVLTSPIVGTFYRRPSPDADPFVQEGDRVKEGQVLCIVEAMKLMNEIEADVSGKILEIVPNDSQPVEYGESLFVIEPD